ncbi:MAG: hypothetical protein JWQ71_1107 [Pedosphaera sp.]|nr:hypothetical protein [Pedosphaera sp.]
MKNIILFTSLVLLLAGCSSLDDNNAGGMGRNSHTSSGVSSQGAGSGAGGVDNSAWTSGEGTGTIGAGKP